MQLIPYIPIPSLKWFGASLFIIGIITLLGIGFIIHRSGEVVAEVETTQPLPETQLAEQAMQATSQAYLQNKMKEMGVPLLYRTDEIEKLQFDFPPINLTPEMGEITVLLEIKSRGIIASDNNSRLRRDFIRTHYVIRNSKTNDVIYDKKWNKKLTINPDEKNRHATIVFNSQDAKVNSLSGLRYERVASFKVPQEASYTLQANIEKLKFAYPIESIKLIAKKGMIEKPSLKFMSIFLIMILLGVVLCIATTPPDKRGKKIK